MATPTVLSQRLKIEEIPVTEVARKLGITRQSAWEMVTGNLKCPRRRQAQIHIYFGIAGVFDERGYAKKYAAGNPPTPDGAA